MLRIRVLATRVEAAALPLPRLIYRAAAFGDSPAEAEPIWTCGHVHPEAIHAEECGLAYLRDASPAADGLPAS
ncbi:MAG: hypothetical protein ACREOM_13360 [Candidatus Dormibacteraceae bacterium]